VRRGAERGDAVRALRLGVLDDPGHGAHGLDRELAHAGLAGEHDRVRAVEDGVRAVRDLGAGGPRRADHRVEHLGGDDDRLGLLACHGDGALLDHRHLLERELDAQVAAGDHDAVERADDLGEVLDRLRLLDLGDDRDPTSLFVHDPLAVLVVGRGADEREGDEVGAEPDRPAEVLLVLVGQRRHAHGDARQVEALVVGDGACHLDPGHDPRPVHLDHANTHAAVVDQDGVAGLAVTRETLVGGRAEFLGSGDVFGGDREDVALSEVVLALHEAAEPDLGTLQVHEHRDVAAGSLRGGPHALVDGLVDRVLAVAPVEARDVHPGVDQGLDHLGGLGRGSHGAYDLRSAHFASLGRSLKVVGRGSDRRSARVRRYPAMTRG